MGGGSSSSGAAPDAAGSAPVKHGQRWFNDDAAQRAVDYDLYGPEVSEACAIFVHGAGADKSHLAHHAQRVAARGVQAFAANCMSITEGGSFHDICVKRSVRPAQLRNVSLLTQHVAWLRASTQKPLAIVGHSAGGAFAMEAAVALQEAGSPASCLVLLDAVPYDETINIVSTLDLEKTPVFSIRFEPSAWNKEGNVAAALALLSPDKDGGLVDILVSKAQHGDAMVATRLTQCIGLHGPAECRQITDDLTFAYLAGHLGISRTEGDQPFEELLRTLSDASKIVIA